MHTELDIFTHLKVESCCLPKILAKLNQSETSKLNKTTRTLTAEEITQLENQGNQSVKWGEVFVLPDFKADYIHNSTFDGKCVLGEFGDMVESIDGVKLTSGIYNSTVSNSEIGSHSLIKNVGIVSNYVIDEKACLFNVGQITAGDKNYFSQDLLIPVGIEVGGREVPNFAELTIPMADLISSGKSREKCCETFKAFFVEYLKACESAFGYVGKKSKISQTPKIKDVFISDYSIIDSVSLLENSLLLGDETDPCKIHSGALVKNSSVQWGADISSLAIVENSLIMEHVNIERHAKVLNSIVGPNSGIAEGEISASLAGPFTGFHHQALLIAALWPDGKGNVGYGANVGSNHTGKAPDQELWCGEGDFFGLGVNIKYPSNFTDSPYTIFATGVNMLPQKIDYPFSLVNKQSASLPNIPPAFNELMPGWVLSENIYMVLRNEIKFKQRNKATRQPIEAHVFTPQIINKMRLARHRLTNVSDIKGFYLPKDIAGIGKNVVTESNRQQAINSYTFYINYYVLKGLYSQLLKYSGNVVDIYTSKTSDDLWEHQRNVLNEDELNQNSISENLETLKSIQQQIAENVRTSKEKDDVRGQRIIPDYGLVHTPAAEDDVVIFVEKETEQLISQVDKILERIS